MTAAAVAVRERPILFSGPMVRAIIEGKKTQTRRVILPQPELLKVSVDGGPFDQPHWLMYPDSPDEKRRACWPEGGAPYWTHCPFGAVGDQLYVRESHYILDMRPDIVLYEHAPQPEADVPVNIVYRADDASRDAFCPPDQWRESFDNDHVEWRPSIHMPRWASRLTLELTDVRIEQLHEISEDDAIDEGCEGFIGEPIDTGERWVLPRESSRDEYRKLWDSLNAKRGFGWDVNPWVWVLSFRRAEQ